MVIRKKVIILSLLLIATKGWSQSKGDLQHANVFYQSGDYANAALYYEKYLGVQRPSSSRTPYTVRNVGNSGKDASSNASVFYMLAESYRNMKNYVQAEPWYEQSLAGKGADSSAEILFGYGICLRANRKYAASRAILNRLVARSSRPGKNEAATELALKELQNLDFIQLQMQNPDTSLYTFTGVGGLQEGAFSPFISSAGEFFFSAPQAEKVSRKAVRYHDRILTAVLDGNGNFSGSRQQPLKAGDDHHQSNASLTADGRRMYFTQWKAENGKENAAIYSSDRGEDGAWSTPVLLGGNINMPGYRTMQPYIGGDGKWLLYTSDAPGGAGGLDLWYAALDGAGTPSKPVNLRNINTTGDEKAPFYYEQERTLVFSSNGRPGMGGFDLFLAQGEPASPGEPSNLGYPVNSVKDDLYFFSSAAGNMLSSAWITSDRNTECCPEIFKVSKAEKPFRQHIDLNVVDCRTGQSIPDAYASIRSEGTGRSLYSGMTTPGTAGFDVSAVYDSLSISVRKEGYRAAERSFVVSNSKRTDTFITLRMCLATAVPADKPEVAGRPGIAYFGYDRADIGPETVSVLDSVIGLMQRNSNIKGEVGGYTDARGSIAYNIKLGAARARACIDYMVERGIAAERLTWRAYGECCPVAPDTMPDGITDNPEGRKLNRRVEFRLAGQTGTDR
jgi:outer membrane protein OmpA-like peptidoglycan-associated protein/tetratricopeptide (TPR) repeat protein